MSEAKYVVVGDDSLVYIFPALIDHSVFVQSIGRMREDVTGAGFVSISPYDAPRCFGRSTSLGIESKPVDTLLLQRMLRWPMD